MSKYEKEEKFELREISQKVREEMRKEKEKEKKRKPTLNLIKPENSKKKRWYFGSETGSF